MPSQIQGLPDLRLNNFVGVNGKTSVADLGRFNDWAWRVGVAINNLKKKVEIAGSAPKDTDLSDSLWRRLPTLPHPHIEPIESEVDVRIEGFTAFGGTTINNNSTDGYFLLKADRTFDTTDAKVRGLSATVRNFRTAADSTYEFSAITGAIEITAANTQTIDGVQRGVASELTFTEPTSGTYTVTTAYNYIAKNFFGESTTVTNWYGYYIPSPTGDVTPGVVTTGYGINIENLNATAILNSTNAAAINIGGIANFGRIKWAGADIQEQASGILQLTSNTNVRSAVGFQVRNAAGTYFGCDAGSYAISNTTIIDASQQISVTGYINTGVGYRISGAAASGDYLRGDGTNFVSSTIQAGDLPSHTHSLADITSGTVNAVSPTSPNRTIEITLGGTTYYLHAKTTND